MFCSWCNFDNLARARYCGGCGRTLQLDAVCVACSAANPADYDFCDACGARLVGPSQLETVSPSAQHSAGVDKALREQVTSAFHQVPRPKEAPPQLAAAVELAAPTSPEVAAVDGEAAAQQEMSWRRVGDWVSSNRWELLAVAIFTGIAAFLRVYRLADLPPGLHGDEALTGLDALRIVDEGWIGPYVGSALGQPTGPLYFTALIFKLSHASLFTVRLSMAILGVATVPLAYLLFRVGFGRWLALFAMAAITFSFWHLHFSRTAFMVISMPLIVSLAALGVLWAMRSASRWPWLLAGLVLGAGVYSYNGYLMFLAAVAVLLAVHLALHRGRRGEQLLRYALLGGGFVLVALPLIQFVVRSPDFYFSHARQVSLLRDPQIAEAGNVFEKIDFVAERGWRAVTLLFRHAEIDGVDATGGRGALHPILAILAYIGLAISLARWRSPPHLLAALAVLAGMSAVVITTAFGGDMRRSLVAIPFVYALAGVAAVEIVLISRRFLGDTGHRAAVVGIAASLVAVIAWNSWYYFGDFVQRDHTQWVFANDFVESLEAAHSFTDPGMIYFYSGRWSFNYEPRRFLYPQSPGIDRSKEFGKFSMDRFDSGPVTYVLIPPYEQELDRLRRINPGGVEVRELDESGAIRFAVYHLR